MRFYAVLVALGLSSTPVSALSHEHADAGRWTLEVALKGRSLLVNPTTCERSFALDQAPNPLGLVSPDGKKVVYIASDPVRVKDGHDFDLFVADVDASQPAGKTNSLRLTTDQTRPVQPLWLPRSTGIVFQAGENPMQQVWYIDLAAGSRPVRLSDGEHRSYDVSILPDGRIAWIVHKGSKQKAQFKDLLLHPSPSVSGKMRTLLADQHISSYQFSPDGTTLVWSGLGSMYLVDLASGDSREIPLHGIHPQLINHTVHQFAWRPDGKIVAIRCGFLGGIAREFNGDPNAPWPRMFAEDKVFFVPVKWAPTPESLKVGEGDSYPSPMADDPRAEVSPPADDESKPWWIREMPQRALALTWVSAEEAQRRLAEYPAPPEAQTDAELPQQPQ